MADATSPRGGGTAQSGAPLIAPLRSAELDRLRGVLEQGRRRAAIAVVRGQAGVGKSWLIERLLETEHAAIEATGTRLLRAGGHPAELDLPFAGLHQLLLPLAADMARLPGPQRDALERALARQPADATHRFAAAVGLHGLLASLGAQRPVLVVIDDAQWVDASTMTSIVFAARRLDADRVTLLLSTRERTQPTGVDAVDIDLAPLTEPDARRLIEAEYPDVTPLVRDELLALAGGLPVVLCEGPADLTVAQRRGLAPLPTVLPIGSTLSWLYRQRMSAIGADGRLAMLIVSLARLEMPTLASALVAAGLEPDVLGDAEAAGLVERSPAGVAPAHATLGAAVQADAGASTMARARRAVSAALIDAPHRQVWFLDGDTGGSDDELAVKWDAAAADAQQRTAWAEAAAAHEHGARRSQGAARRQRLVAAALCHGRGGAPGPMLRLLDELVAETDHPSERLQLESQRIAARSWLRPQAIDADAVRALIADNPGASRQAVTMILSGLAVTALLWGDHAGALAAVDEAGAHADRNGHGDGAGDGAGDGHGLADRLVRDIVETITARAGAGDVLRGGWIDEVTDEQLLDPTVPVFLATFVLVLIDEIEHGAVVANRLRAVAGRVNDLGQLGIATALVGLVEQRRGDMLGARAHYSAAARLCLDTDFTAPLAHIELRHAHLLAALGNEAPCRSIVATASGGSGASPAIAHLVTATLGLLELSVGDCADAARLLEDAEDQLVEMQLGEPGYITATGDLVEALWRLRRTDRAGAVLERHAQRADAAGRHSAQAIVQRGRGLLCDAESIDEQFELAHRQHDLAPDGYQRARTDLCWGMRLRRARRKSDARVPLRAALNAFEAMGAAPWAARAAAELTACGERRRTAWGAVDELTPRELEVAVAVADGATNPVAAAALCISVRTVEDHLTRIYRKLGIAGRDGLATALARPGQPASASRI